MIDGVSIKSATIYNPSTGCYDGFVDYGPSITLPEIDAKKTATEALVFMLVGLRGHWKYPVGYVLCDKISAYNLHRLISCCLSTAAVHDINILSVTMDGAAANLEAMRCFGCKFGIKRDSISSKFKHPSTAADVFFVPDACHMVKLARNALADFGVFIDGQNRNIKWEYIVKLHEVQSLEGLKFANKLSNQHVEFQRHKMNVRLAVQTISSSVADALDFLHSVQHPDFQDVDGTVTFIRNIDRLFDILNSRSPFGKGFK